MTEEAVHNATLDELRDHIAECKQKREPSTREFSFPLIDGVAVLRVPHPMGQANYDLLTAVLDAAKAALVGPNSAEPKT